MRTEPVTLTLTRAKALVLFEYFYRTDEEGELPTVHPAEQLVLWDIEGQLESALWEPFHPDYKEMLRKAREAHQDGG